MAKWELTRLCSAVKLKSTHGKLTSAEGNLSVRKWNVGSAFGAERDTNKRKAVGLLISERR